MSQRRPAGTPNVQCWLHERRKGRVAFSHPAARWSRAAAAVEVKALEPARRILGHTRAVQQILFAPNNRWFVTVGLRGGAKIWDASTFMLIGIVKMHNGKYVGAAAIEPHGRAIAWTGRDTVAVIRTLPSGAPVPESLTVLLKWRATEDNAPARQQRPHVSWSSALHLAVTTGRRLLVFYLSLPTDVRQPVLHHAFVFHDLPSPSLAAWCTPTDKLSYLAVAYANGLAVLEVPNTLPCFDRTPTAPPAAPPRRRKRVPMTRLSAMPLFVFELATPKTQRVRYVAFANPTLPTLLVRVGPRQSLKTIGAPVLIHISPEGKGAGGGWVHIASGVHDANSKVAAWRQELRRWQSARDSSDTLRADTATALNGSAAAGNNGDGDAVPPQERPPDYRNMTRRELTRLCRMRSLVQGSFAPYANVELMELLEGDDLTPQGAAGGGSGDDASMRSRDSRSSTLSRPSHAADADDSSSSSSSNGSSGTGSTSSSKATSASVEYDQLLYKDLRELCKIRGIKLSGRLTKVALVRALEAVDAEEDSGSESRGTSFSDDPSGSSDAAMGEEEEEEGEGESSSPTHISATGDGDALREGPVTSRENTANPAASYESLCIQELRALYQSRGLGLAPDRVSRAPRSALITALRVRDVIRGTAGYESLRIPDLEMLCKQRGIPVRRSITRALLIEGIRSGRCYEAAAARAGGVDDVDFDGLRIDDLLALAGLPSRTLSAETMRAVLRYYDRTATAPARAFMKGAGIDLLREARGGDASHVGMGLALLQTAAEAPAEKPAPKDVPPLPSVQELEQMPVACLRELCFQRNVIPMGGFTKQQLIAALLTQRDTDRKGAAAHAPGAQPDITYRRFYRNRLVPLKTPARRVFETALARTAKMPPKPRRSSHTCLEHRPVGNHAASVLVDLAADGILRVLHKKGDECAYAEWNGFGTVTCQQLLYIDNRDIAPLSVVSHPRFPRVVSVRLATQEVEHWDVEASPPVKLNTSLHKSEDPIASDARVLGASPAFTSDGRLMIVADNIGMMSIFTTHGLARICEAPVQQFFAEEFEDHDQPAVLLPWVAGVDPVRSVIRQHVMNYLNLEPTDGVPLTPVDEEDALVYHLSAVHSDGESAASAWFSDNSDTEEEDVGTDVQSASTSPPPTQLPFPMPLPSSLGGGTGSSVLAPTLPTFGSMTSENPAATLPSGGGGSGDPATNAGLAASASDNEDIDVATLSTTASSRGPCSDVSDTESGSSSTGRANDAQGSARGGATKRAAGRRSASPTQTRNGGPAQGRASRRRSAAVRGDANAEIDYTKLTNRQLRKLCRVRFINPAEEADRDALLRLLRLEDSMMAYSDSDASDAHEGMTVDQLRHLCYTRGVDHEGDAAALVERLQAAADRRWRGRLARHLASLPGAELCAAARQHCILDIGTREHVITRLASTVDREAARALMRDGEDDKAPAPRQQQRRRRCRRASTATSTSDTDSASDSESASGSSSAPSTSSSSCSRRSLRIDGDYASMAHESLITVCLLRNLTYSGSRAQIIKRLLADDALRRYPGRGRKRGGDGAAAPGDAPNDASDGPAAKRRKTANGAVAGGRRGHVVVSSSEEGEGGSVSGDSLGGKRIDELRTMCTANGIPRVGRKEELVIRLRRHRRGEQMEEEFDRLPLQRLQALCVERGLPTEGDKPVLVIRLRDHARANVATRDPPSGREGAAAAAAPPADGHEGGDSEEHEEDEEEESEEATASDDTASSCPYKNLTGKRLHELCVAKGLARFTSKSTGYSRTQLIARLRRSDAGGGDDANSPESASSTAASSDGEDIAAPGGGASYDELPVNILRKLCINRRLNIYGTRRDLLRRLRRFDQVRHVPAPSGPYGGKSMAELRAVCKERGIRSGRTRVATIGILEEHDRNPPPPTAHGAQQQGVAPTGVRGAPAAGALAPVGGTAADDDPLEVLNLADLRLRCQERRLSTRGTAAELRARLMATASAASAATTAAAPGITRTGTLLVSEVQAQPRAPASTDTGGSLEHLPLLELQELCRRHGLPVGGLRHEVLRRLVAAGVAAALKRGRPGDGDGSGGADAPPSKRVCLEPRSLGNPPRPPQTAPVGYTGLTDDGDSTDSDLPPLFPGGPRMRARQDGGSGGVHRGRPYAADITPPHGDALLLFAADPRQAAAADTPPVPTLPVDGNFDVCSLATLQELCDHYGLSHGGTRRTMVLALRRLLTTPGQRSR